MDKILTFQMSLFGSYINIEPRNEITMQLSNVLKDEEFVPSTFEVAVVDPVEKQVSSESRLQMVSQDKTWNIIFLQERIDFNYHYLGGNSYFVGFDDIFSIAKRIVEKTFSCFSDTIGNRVAVNARWLLDEMTEEKRNIFINTFSNPGIVFDGKVEEWLIRCNDKTEIAVGDGNVERCNCLLEITDSIETNYDKISKRFVVLNDINSEIELRDNRFHYSNLLAFAENAKNIMETIAKKIERV